MDTCHRYRCRHRYDHYHRCTTNTLTDCDSCCDDDYLTLLIYIGLVRLYIDDVAVVVVAAGAAAAAAADANLGSSGVAHYYNGLAAIVVVAVNAAVKYAAMNHNCSVTLDYDDY